MSRRTRFAIGAGVAATALAAGIAWASIPDGAGVFHGWLTSHAWGAPPSATTTALTAPVCGAPGGRKSYMNFQMTPAATKEIAIGRKTMPLATLS